MKQKETWKKRFRCALKLILKVRFVQISELSLLPGTPLYYQYHKKLKFDGRFSNFSNTFCNPQELKLIKKYPEMFSSFYYLPVKTVKHKEMHYLCRLLNLLFHFRNTLYLLRDLLNRISKVKNCYNLLKMILQDWEG
jgi:hypothetical protein